MADVFIEGPLEFEGTLVLEKGQFRLIGKGRIALVDEDEVGQLGDSLLYALRKNQAYDWWIFK